MLDRCVEKKEFFKRNGKDNFNKGRRKYIYFLEYIIYYFIIYIILTFRIMYITGKCLRSTIYIKSVE